MTTRTQNYFKAWKTLCEAVKESPGDPFNPDEPSHSSRQEFYAIYAKLSEGQRKQLLQNLTPSRVGRRTLLRREIKDYIRGLNPEDSPVLYSLISYRESRANDEFGIIELILVGADKLL